MKADEIKRIHVSGDDIWSREIAVQLAERNELLRESNKTQKDIANMVKGAIDAILNMVVSRIRNGS